MDRVLRPEKIHSAELSDLCHYFLGYTAQVFAFCTLLLPAAGSGLGPF